MKKNVISILSCILASIFIFIGCTINMLDKEGQTASSQNEFYMTVLEYGIEDNPSMADLFSTPDSLLHLKNMNKLLHEKFDYFELGFQSLFYVGTYDKPEKFTSSFDSTQGTNINYEIPLPDGTSMYVTDLKTIQLGEKLYKEFEDNILLGENFCAEDFSVNTSDAVIPVILGYEYLQYYQTGDMLMLSLHEKPLTFKVIGFYQENTAFQFETSNISLDQCIVMPFYNILYAPTNDCEDSYQKIFYTQKNEGYIQIPETATQNEFRDTALEILHLLAQQENLLFTLPLSPTKINF